jgi:hypothetical protein
MKKVQQKHWYKITREECVLCGHSDEYRQRVYGEKPQDYIPDFKQTACGCHFC